MSELELDRDLLIRTFLDEANEILAALEEQVVALEARPDDEEAVQALFRGAHTLKGSAATVAFDTVRDVAHDLEGVLGRLRARELRADRGVASLLLAGVDALRAALAECAAGNTTMLSEEGEAVRERLRGVRAGTAPVAERFLERAGAAETGRTLRVDVAKLDRMVNVSGEIAIARGRLTELLERGSGVAREELLEAHREADRLYLDLQDLIMTARMVAIGPTFRQHVRTVRDVAAAAGKRARLVLQGEDVEVDTAVIAQVRDPLTHLVRNAVDHGLEGTEARAAAGKDPCGTVTLRAFHEGGTVVVEVSDDGAGLDLERIAERARALGVGADGDVERLIFVPGLSTSAAVTELSGRGVGMDIVRRNVESLRGTIHVRTGRGVGTTIQIRLPLTLALIQGFRVSVADQSYIVPLDAVVECLELPAGAGDGERGVLSVRGQPLPYLRLRRHLGLEGVPPPRESVLVVQHGSDRAGLAVDALHGESQTVVKPLGRALRDAPGVSASAILGNGRVALILDVPGLLAQAVRHAGAPARGRVCHVSEDA